MGRDPCTCIGTVLCPACRAWRRDHPRTPATAETAQVLPEEDLSTCPAGHALIDHWYERPGRPPGYGYCRACRRKSRPRRTQGRHAKRVPKELKKQAPAAAAPVAPGHAYNGLVRFRHHGGR